MNKQISKLIKQATTIRYSGPGEIEEFDREKFAELIVQECLDQITGFKTEYHVQDHALAKIQSNIVKHFGVGQ